MSNYHILETNDKEDKIKAVFHIAVPDEDNAASINLRLALKQHLESISEDSTIHSLVPWITTELTSLQDGSIYEHVETVEVDANLTLLQKRGLVDSKYNQLASNIPDKIRARLRFWGLDHDVV